jgi:hypothetical protein
MKLPQTFLNRIEKLEAKAPGKTGNWVRALSGEIIWDPYDFPEPTAEEGAATKARLIAEMDQIAARLRTEKGWKEPTPEQIAETKCGLDEVLEKMQAEKQIVRDFTAQVERERAL